MDFVFREDLPPQYTTDIIVAIDVMIKGTPNAGENHVKFMIPGGEGVNPTTGEAAIAWSSGAPEFEIGERVFMFLKKHKRLIEQRRLRKLSPPPYEGIMTAWWGSIKIRHEEVAMPYTFKKILFDNGQQRERSQIREVHLPINLARQIAQAAAKDATAVSTIDEKIRAFVKKSPIVPGQRLMPDQAFLDRIEANLKPILIEIQTNGKSGYR